MTVDLNVVRREGREGGREGGWKGEGGRVGREGECRYGENKAVRQGGRGERRRGKEEQDGQ